MKSRIRQYLLLIIYTWLPIEMISKNLCQYLRRTVSIRMHHMTGITHHYYHQILMIRYNCFCSTVYYLCEMRIYFNSMGLFMHVTNYIVYSRIKACHVVKIEKKSVYTCRLSTEAFYSRPLIFFDSNELVSTIQLSDSSLNLISF